MRASRDESVGVSPCLEGRQAAAISLVFAVCRKQFETNSAGETDLVQLSANHSAKEFPAIWRRCRSLGNVYLAAFRVGRRSTATRVTKPVPSKSREEGS